MTGRIPKYGENFSLEHMPYDFTQDLANRRYVLKSDRRYFIRSTRNSEHWRIFYTNTAGTIFPVEPENMPHSTLKAAMAHLVSMLANGHIKPKEA